MIPALLIAAAAASLPQVKERLGEERAQAAKLAGREQSVLERLADLERQVEVESSGLRAAQARLRTATQRVAAAEDRARQAQAELRRGGDAMAPRLLARYRMGREGYLRFLLGATSISDVLRRRRVLNVLIEGDLTALTALKLRVEGEKLARDELAAARAEQEESVAAEAARREALTAAAAEQRKLLASVQEERAVHDQAVAELEQAEHELSQRLAEMQPRADLVVPEIELRASIRKAQGTLPFPVQGGRVEARFGRSLDGRFNTVTLRTGIDVRAKEGTPVRAIFDGKVAHAGWFRGFGNLLIIDHGDGVFSLMAHLGRMEKAVGDRVQGGDEVGTVGDTGSLKGAYLYFELRDGQKPLDPEQWLSRPGKSPALLAGAKGGAAK